MIRVACPNCGKHYSVLEENAGRKGRCSGCGTVFRVPEAAVPMPQAPSPAPPPRGTRRTLFPQSPLLQQPSLRRRASPLRWIAGAAMICALIAAGALVVWPAVFPRSNGTQKTSDDRLLVDGDWAGTTSDGHAIYFTIANNAITRATMPTYCEGTRGSLSGESSLVFTLIPQPISGRQLSISGGNSAGDVSFEVTGRFESSTSISGTLTVTLSAKSSVGGGSATTTWTATRK
jgi:predicted Zn finger-like uncharacterized protein